MVLLTLVIAICFVQIWGKNNPVHKDAWFYKWIEGVQKRLLPSVQEGAASDSENSTDFVDENDEPLKKIPRFFRIVTSPLFLGVYIVGAPVVAILIVACLLSHFSYWLLLPFYILLLLYSFGRGNFSETIGEYAKASYVEDWEAAVNKAQQLGLDAQNIISGDWSALHRRVFEQAAYRGFEKSFVVIFWLLFLGPVFTVFYRLLFLYVQKNTNDRIAEHILWVIEWPVVRLLGLTFALTGNFVGCFSVLKETLFDFQQTAKYNLSRLVKGAFVADEQESVTFDVTRKEINLLSKLYQRTLWFWLIALALITLVW